MGILSHMFHSNFLWSFEKGGPEHEFCGLLWLKKTKYDQLVGFKKVRLERSDPKRPLVIDPLCRQ